MGKSKAPEYQKTTTSTGGLFGQATNDKTGSSFKAEDWQTDMGGLGSNLINQSLTGLSSNDYSQDPNFQVYQDNFNRGMQQAYDTNVLGNLTDRGLMRSSGLQAATNSFNNTMQQGLADLAEIIVNAKKHLTVNGWVVLEHGYDQGDAVQHLFRQAGYKKVRTVKDYGGNDRVTLGQWPH